MPQPPQPPEEQGGKLTSTEIFFLVVAIFVIIVTIFVTGYHKPKSVSGPEPKPITQEQPKSANKKSGQAEGWVDTKNVLYNVIYKDHNIDLYYGCKYTDITHVDFSSCNLPADVKEKKRAGWIEAEHIVPASLQPAHEFACWKETRRQGCEKNDPRAQAMIYDLHNLAPAIGQVNADRGNKRYGEAADDNTFVPNDCVKGDVARTWLYMHDQYGVVLAPGEAEMFTRWSANDPVSPWEAEREKRVKKYTFVDNPYVKGQTPDPKGVCPWEK